MIQLKYILSFLLLTFTNLCLAQSKSPFQLAKPIIKKTATFFTDSSEVQLELDMEGVEIYYSLDGNEPDTSAMLYQEAIRINDNATLKAVAVHDDCRNSEVASCQLFKVHPFDVLEASVSPMPDERYAGDGVSTLVDRVKGSTNFKDNKWLAVGKVDMEVTLQLTDSIDLSGVTVSTISDPRSWIFPPVGMEVWIAGEENSFVKVETLEVPILSAMEKPNLQFQTCTFTPHKTNHIKVIIKNTGNMPDWHHRAGRGSWLFVDEIILETNE